MNTRHHMAQPKRCRPVGTARTAPGQWRRQALRVLRPASKWSLLATCIGLTAAAPASAESAWKLSAEYVADVSGAVSGGTSKSGRALDNLLIDLDGDLERAFGWSGASVHVSLLNNTGGQPNEIAGTLQGVDNIEVTRPRGKIYEAWIEQKIGAASVRVGLYDLNSEFYANDAAGLLISPAFGIGSELAATGPNGPSIFPSTSPAVRLRVAPSESFYVQAAALGAMAGVVGDPGGVHLNLDDGALVIAEGGWTGRGKVAVGAWRYTRRQDSLFDLDASGQPAKRTAVGAYLLVEQPLVGQDGDVRALTGFLRVGFSDGQTTPFNGGTQIGVLVNRVFEGRPDSALSFGLNEGRLSSDFRRDLRAGGGQAARAEYYAELTYADQITDRVSLQPSFQYVVNPGGDRRAHDALVVTLRARVKLH